MAIYPAAHVDLLTKGSPTALTRVDGYVAHTIVGSAASAINLFKGNGYGGSTAHFVMDYAGKVTQLVDTKHRANCQVDGNWRLLSCEHADYGEGFPTWNLNDGSQVPAFTDAQVAAEIELQVWMAKTHGFPVWLMESSMSTEKGIGWHKLGVNPYRIAGSEVWSSSYGKQCPGSRRIDQLKNVIFPAVRARVNPPPKAPTPNVPKPPTPKPATTRGHDMFLFRRKNPGSGVRLFTGSAAPINSDFNDQNAAEIGKALADPTHIASIDAAQFDWLVKALDPQ